jgi:sarcinarray family protein
MGKMIVLVGCLIIIVLLSANGSASSPYLDIQVYYNDQLYPGAETPKPLVRIEEPFTLRFDITVNQECLFYADLSDLGNFQGIESFVVVDGPSELGDYHERICEKNDTFSYEWTLKPTERWAGGSMPINFHYGILLKGMSDPIVNSEFTAAYVTISNEYYEPTYATTKPGAQSRGDTTSPALPAFTLPAALAAMYTAYILRKH